MTASTLEESTPEDPSAGAPPGLKEGVVLEEKLLLARLQGLVERAVALSEVLSYPCRSFRGTTHSLSPCQRCYPLSVIIGMIRWTGFAPWEFEYPFPGSPTSTVLFVSLNLATHYPLPLRGATHSMSPSQKCYPLPLRGATHSLSEVTTHSLIRS